MIVASCTRIKNKTKIIGSGFFLVDVTLEGVYKAASTHVLPSGAWICVGKVEEHAWISVLKR
jgi:hypothetical protein